MNSIIAFTKLIRFPNLIIIVLTQYAIRYGIFYPILLSFSQSSGIGFRMSELDFFLLTLSTVMIAAAGYIINDYFDLKVDRVNRPDKIIVGKYIKRRVAMGSHIVINCIAVFLATYVAYKAGNWKLTFIQLFSIGALWYYSVIFKKRVLTGNIIVALLAALVPFVSGLYELLLQHTYIDETINQLMFFVDEGVSFDEVKYLFSEVLWNLMLWSLGFSLFAFMSTMVREIIKDIEDYEGDKKYFSNTLPVVHGKKKAKIVAQAFSGVMVVLIGYLQYTQVKQNEMAYFTYFLFAIQLPLLYIIYHLNMAKEKEDYSKLSRYMKIVMFMGITYTLFFCYTTINT